MEKKDLIFLATSVLMVKSEKGDILNEDGKDYFKKYDPSGFRVGTPNP